MKTVYIPMDSAALALGADDLVAPLQAWASDHGQEIRIVRNGSRGMLWLEPLIEVETERGRVGYAGASADTLPQWLAAGLLEGAAPEERIRDEAEEETGYRVHHVQKVFEAYMSPGSVTEKLHFFIAEYDASSKVSEGGGLEEETEELEVLEWPFDDALEAFYRGEICDAKTIMLLQHAAMKNIFSA